MDVIWDIGSGFGVGGPRINWTEVMEMDYPMFQLVRNKVVELRNEEIKRLKKRQT